MGMIEVVMTVCALSQPSQCEEQHLQFAWQGSVAHCVMNAQPYLAQWINEHPKWSVARWHCEVPHPREKADARGSARPA
jgi:hypothetical protein